MYRLPVDPYYVNAATWWLENNNSNNDQFKVWMKSQGTVIEEHDSYYPWLDFESGLLMILFRMKWTNENDSI
jgi:hypothetical protein